MILAAYMVTGFVVASVYAVGILRSRREASVYAAGILRSPRDRYNYAGFALGFIPAAIVTPFQIFVGDTAARAIAHDQPVKFAAMEYVPQTSRHVPEWLGGVYVNGRIYAGVKIPYMDSLLVGFAPGTRVTGWDSVPPPSRPPVVWLIHLAFDAMVGLGCCSGRPSRSAAWPRSWRWSAAGWSPRSVGSRGWYMDSRPPPRPPRPTAAC
jgi:cytochrome d ubiquinol oxidase subunit I